MLKVRLLLLILTTLFANGSGYAKPHVCENTFVISGYDDHIYLFEHNRNATKLKLLADLPFRGEDAFYDCKRHRIVYFKKYGQKDRQKGLKDGVGMYDLKRKREKIVPVDKGHNVSVARYKDGFIFSTARIDIDPVNRERYGCIPTEFIFSKEMVLNTPGWEAGIINDYKQGKRWYRHSINYYFDLKQEKITKRYPFGMIVWGEVADDYLYAVTLGGLIRIDLQKVYSKDIFACVSKDPLYVHRKLYYLSSAVSLGGRFFLVSSNSKRQTIAPGIYTIKDKQVTFLHPLPNVRVSTAIGVDGRYMYVFLKNDKVLRYDTQANIIDKHYDLRSVHPKGTSLASVNVTPEGFVMTFAKKALRPESKTYLIVSDREFNKFSKPFKLSIGGAHITTQLSLLGRYIPF